MRTTNWIPRVTRLLWTSAQLFSFSDRDQTNPSYSISVHRLLEESNNCVGWSGSTDHSANECTHRSEGVDNARTPNIIKCVKRTNEMIISGTEQTQHLQQRCSSTKRTKLREKLRSDQPALFCDFYAAFTWTPRSEPRTSPCCRSTFGWRIVESSQFDRHSSSTNTATATTQREQVV